ncbi:hypothetical protein E1265_13460 [Streptomyces sp. 8K308]|uniref:hypothetical protein n=1 Tax=Streptomyces sp. 8K308 TaxID=2530388 RepID=UPI0010536854|nr:hypothetical protein [Streptomyces sp. 8K308]TDC23222.1 hypothetical protein E1265_13460 [Streptomyces sp. 8K308]
MTARPAGWSTSFRASGPLPLWNAVEDAILTWQAEGSPHPSGFGLTVSPEGQHVWLGSPDGPGWNLPV